MTGLLEYDRRHGWRGAEAASRIAGSVFGLPKRATPRHRRPASRHRDRIWQRNIDASHRRRANPCHWKIWLELGTGRLDHRDALGPEPADTGFLSPGDVVRLPKYGEPMLAQLPDAQAGLCR